MAVLISVLYALAMLVLFVYGVNLLWLSARFKDLTMLEPGPVPEPGDPPPPVRPWPQVTVQLPVYNEAHVVERLIDACASLDYPRHSLEIQVLDDSDDATCEIAARRVAWWRSRGVDIVHVQRAERDGYKAGALQNGLLLASGDFIAIFDADFVPQPDFLRQLIPHFDEDDVGLVQARWGHLNADHSLLTRIQAFGLDAHFGLEQRVRNAIGCFMNFNGTAGIWRRRCIEDAGGWTFDTLTEDLDLSYRAQLKEWKFRYLPHVEVPAQLPVEMNGFRSQQFRWTKGAVQTARKLLPALWSSAVSLRTKVQGTVHLTAHLVFPFVVLAALLHAPLVHMNTLEGMPGEVYFAVMGVGLLGLAGFCLSQVFAQLSLYPDWSTRLRLFPLFMAGSMGLSLSNTRAVFQAMIGRQSPFVRTPKYGPDVASSWWTSTYARLELAPVVLLEAIMTLYCLGGLVLLITTGAWAAVPFQVIFTLGFGLVAAFGLRVLGVRDRRPRPSPHLVRI